MFTIQAKPPQRLALKSRVINNRLLTCIEGINFA